MKSSVSLEYIILGIEINLLIEQVFIDYLHIQVFQHTHNLTYQTWDSNVKYYCHDDYYKEEA